MIPVNLTVQFIRDGAKDSASLPLSMDMTAVEAVDHIVQSLSLSADTTYRLLHQRQLLSTQTRLFEAGVQEGDILQLTIFDAKTTVGALDLGRSIAGSILNRLGGKAGAEPLPLQAALFTRDGEPFMLRHTRALIGRADESMGFPSEVLDVELTALDPNLTVSRPHAMIVYSDSGFTIRDLYSQRGLWVNGERVSASHSQPIYDGDVLSIGEVELQFRCEH